MWREAIEKELKQLDDYDTFRIPNKGETLKDHKLIQYHIVFDVKFDLRRKARLVANGNMADTPDDTTYSGVVSLESIRMLFLLAEINNLDIWAADVGNAYLYSKTKEKVFVIGGEEFGTDRKGKPLSIHKSLYGLATSSAHFHEHLAKKLCTMGFKPSKADANL